MSKPSANGRTQNRTVFLLWLLSAVPIFVLISVPTSTGGQAFLGIVGVLLVAGMKPFVSRMVVRFALLATATVIVMRYWLWRLLETIPDPSISVAFLVAVLLFVVETYSIMVFLLNAFINADPTDRPFPQQVSPEDLPTVDILVPSYNEPIEMLSITLTAARNMIYPTDKRTVVLCDDGGTDQRCNSDNAELAAASRQRQGRRRGRGGCVGVRGAGGGDPDEPADGAVGGRVGHPGTAQGVEHLRGRERGELNARAWGNDEKPTRAKGVYTRSTGRTSHTPPFNII